MLLSEQAIPNEWEIAEYLEKAYNSDPAELKRIGDKARRFTLNYDWEKVVQPLWVNLIERLREDMHPKSVEERRINL